MTPIVRQTRYGNTMFVPNPIKAAWAMVTWATAHAHKLCVLENLGHGCIRVNIPGLTHIILAPEEKKHELSYYG